MVIAIATVTATVTAMVTAMAMVILMAIMEAMRNKKMMMASWLVSLENADNK